MTHVSEHHTEEEWECCDCQHSWIGLEVLGYSIGVDYQLIDVCEVVCFDVGRRCNRMVLISLNTHRVVALKTLRYVVLFIDWGPEVASEGL